MPALSILVWLPALTGLLAAALSWRPWQAGIPPASPPPAWWAEVAPAARAGRFARYGFERRVVDDTIVGGTTGLVRAGSAAVRAAQSGFVRYYAALLVLGITGVSLYFLLQS